MKIAMQTFKKSVLALSMAAAWPSFAEDKSATREGLVKLPASGGTVQKDESSFDFSSSRGSASYTVPLPALPSRGGMKPSLSFVYNQNAGDGGSGLGIGWSISSSAIAFNDDLGTALKQRRVDNEDFISHVALDGQRLIPHGSNAVGKPYEYSVEGVSTFFKIAYSKDPKQVSYLGLNGEKLNYAFPGGFVVTASNGRKSYYAEDPGSAEMDPANHSHVVRWPIVAEVNPEGEAIFYRYVKQGERSYLKQASFAGGQSQYNFEIIQTRPSLVSHRSAFRQVNQVLYGGVSAVFRAQIQSQFCLAFLGRDSQSDAFVVRSGEHCSVEAKKDMAALVSQTSSRSLNILDQLRYVYRFGSGTSFEARNAFPKLSFDYSNWQESDLQRNIVFPAKALGQAATATNFELFDYNLDAVVDLIKETDQSVSVGLGTDNLDTSFAQTVNWTVERDSVKIKPKLGSPAWHFVDVNGDSATDLVEIAAGQMHVYLRLTDGGFAPAHSLDIPWINPSLFGSRNLRWIDLNNDGLTDLIGTEIQSDKLVWKILINQTAKIDGAYDYYFLESTQQLPFKAPLNSLLANDSILFADINGDQLQDLVRIRPDRGGLCVYENQGNVYGEETEKLFAEEGTDVLSQSNCESGRFIAVDGLSHDLQTASRRVWFLDANGDGILDLVSFTTDDSQMNVWLGFGNGDFLQNPLHFSTLDAVGRPQINVQSGRDQTRVSDIDGDGQAELVIFQPGVPGLKPVVVIDFNRLGNSQLIKSNLLTTINNATGLRYDLRYAASIDELTRDRTQGLTSKALPFPLYVVKQIVTSEADPLRAGEFLDGREVKEMLYHDPVYNTEAKKLVGFQNVETLTYGDEFKDIKNQTQRSSYKHETFESDYRLAGRLRDVRVHEFSPSEKFNEQSESTHNLSLKEITVHSMKEYAKAQPLADFGAILMSEHNTWQLVPYVAGYEGDESYLVRQLDSTQSTFGSDGQSAQFRKSWADFDEFNIAKTYVESRGEVQGPGGVTIPARTSRNVTNFEKSRQDLAALDIVSLPSSQESFVSDGVREIKTGLISYEYGPTGQLIRKTESAKVENLPSIPSYKPTADKTYESSYDNFGNPITQSLNAVLLETVGYDSTGTTPILQRNAVGHKTQMYYGHDAMDGCSRSPDLQVQEGQIRGYKDPRGVCHFFSYDNFGRRTQYLRDDGYQELYSYHFAEGGKPSRILKQSRRFASSTALAAGDTEWVESLEAFTPAGVKTAVLEPLEIGNGVRVVSYEEYNRKKNVDRVYSPFKDETNSLRSIFESGLIVSAGKGVFTQTTYDGMDRPSRRIFPTGRVEEAKFEAWGHSLTSRYDLGGGNGERTVIKKFVKFDKQVFATIDERSAVTRFNYDLNNNLSEIWMPGSTVPRRYVYDGLNRKLQQCAPEVGCSSFAYDQLGQLASRVNFDNLGHKTSELTYFYDVLGRLQELNEDGRLAVKNTYDTYPVAYQSAAQASAIGLQTSAQSLDANKLYDQVKVMSYDLAGRVVQRQIDIKGVQAMTLNEKFSFTLDGALQESEDPFGVRSYYKLSPTLRFTHLEMALPWQRNLRETIIDKVSYNAAGQAEQILYRKGSMTSLAFDEKTLQISQIQSSFKRPNGQTEFLQNASLAFNGNGSVTEIIDSVPAQTSQGAVDRSARYEYNERDELIRSERYGEVHTYNYDLAGNFTQNTELGQHLVAAAGSKLLPPSSDELKYEFNAMGQLQSRNFSGRVASLDPLQDLQKRRGIVASKFNGMGQLVYMKTDTQELFYGYDTEGQRAYKRVKDLGSMKLADSLFPSKTAVIESTGAQSFVFIGNRRLARIDHAADALTAGQWYYYLLDHLGSTDFTMHENGSPVEQMIYRAYGSEPELNKLSQGPQWEQHRAQNQSILPKERTHNRFTSHYLDDDTGLYYFGARYYDPMAGRFVSADPMFMDQPEKCVKSPIECNLYSYAANNPMKYIDPTGFAIQELTDAQWNTVSQARDVAVANLKNLVASLDKQFPEVALPVEVKNGLEKYMGIKPDAKTGMYNAAELKDLSFGLWKIQHQLAGMKRENFAFDSAPAKPNTFAYVYRDKNDKMYLANKFFNAPDKGIDSKAGTLVHEGSHYESTMGARDHVYGAEGAEDLAKDDPAKARKNADNVEYLYETTAKP
ncbi:MAG TPA: M35 family metallo-endopeptidase [Oligoflexus sp.]|uniref:M35 family metallo-endopeptidase n=1 Tax=Oligoflexus sp. TaxID=1971216 RepID=UPI002D696685|nr:M35 family metallo-endopeptidase [Oligoflexus sp.]HYX37138.1 M35 family metallo-endopeptidase [Oligoflexus sp.]